MPKKIKLAKEGKMPKPVLSDKDSAEVRQLAKSYYGLQKERIETFNRIDMFVRDYKLSKDEAKTLHDNIDGNIIKSEKYLAKRIGYKVDDLIIYTWMRSNKGVGPILSAGLISGICPENDEGIKGIAKFPNVSKLWRYCGLAVIDGKAEKKVAGEIIHYSPDMKVLCWKLGESFVKVYNNPDAYYGAWFKRYWDDEKQKNVPRETPLEDLMGKIICEDVGNIKSGTKIMKRGRTKFKSEKFKSEGIGFEKIKTEAEQAGKTAVIAKLCDGHILARAKRKTVKHFIADLWTVWRQSEGLPVTKPYLEEKLGHKVSLPPNLHIVSGLKTLAKEKRKDEDYEEEPLIPTPMDA